MTNWVGLLISPFVSSASNPTFCVFQFRNLFDQRVIEAWYTATLAIKLFTFQT